MSTTPGFSGAKTSLFPERVLVRSICARLASRRVSLFLPIRRASSPIPLEYPASLRKEERQHQREPEHAARDEPEGMRGVNERHALGTHREYPADKTERKKDEVDHGECLHYFVLGGVQ